MDAHVARLRPDSPALAWQGAVTAEVTAGLRERLFEALQAPGETSAYLDVRRVTSIDASGVAVLVGARSRARAAGRTLVLLDSAGPVTRALQRAHLLSAFTVTSVIRAADRPVDTTAGAAVRPAARPARGAG
jgi:anti-anti-sigma factor